MVLEIFLRFTVHGSLNLRFLQFVYITSLGLTNPFIADKVTEFFPERISAFFEDRSVKNYRFISTSYRFFEPGGGELA